LFLQTSPRVWPPLCALQPPPRRLSASPGTPYTAADASVRRASAHRNHCTVDAHAFAMLRTLGLPLKRVGGNSRHAGRSNAFERRGPRATCEAVRNCPRRRRGRVPAQEPTHRPAAMTLECGAGRRTVDIPNRRQPTTRASSGLSGRAARGSVSLRKMACRSRCWKSIWRFKAIDPR
jgi:hypothetical protein